MIQTSTKKTTLKLSRSMQTNHGIRIAILETEVVVGANVFFCKSASYKESAPFSAIFSVCDIDHALTTDKATGKKTLEVHCQWGTQKTGKSILHIDIADALLHAGEGYSGQVVTRIDWAK
jgi:hypothetical protein